MQKFVMKLIKKYNIDIKTERNIKIKECYSSAYYQKIIDDELPLDPIEKNVLKSVNYCGINKIKERIFLIKKVPKISKEIVTKFSFEILSEKIPNFIKDKNPNKTNMKNFKYPNNEIYEMIVSFNETIKSNLFLMNNFFYKNIVNDKELYMNFSSEKNINDINNLKIIKENKFIDNSHSFSANANSLNLKNGQFV